MQPRRASNERWAINGGDLLINVAAYPRIYAPLGLKRNLPFGCRIPKKLF